MIATLIYSNIFINVLYFIERLNEHTCTEFRLLLHETNRRNKLLVSIASLQPDPRVFRAN